MTYREHSEPNALLFGYDPVRDLSENHLARFVEDIVEEVVSRPSKPVSAGQPAYDPRLCVKVLVYAYATGTRSSRQMERACREDLAYLFLTRGQHPSYRTLCSARIQYKALIEKVWLHLLLTAQRAKLARVGRIVVDSSKFLANASAESVIVASEMAALRDQIREIVREAEAVDCREDAEGHRSDPELSKPAANDQMRDIIRSVRKDLHRTKEATTLQSQVNALDRSEAAPEISQEVASSAQGVPAETLEVHSEARDGSGQAQAADAQENTHKRVFNVSDKMLKRLKVIDAGLEEAIQAGSKHLSVTDLEARMMREGRNKRITMCHSYEVAVDKGLLVAAGVSNNTTDAERLMVLVEQAKENEPLGVTAVDADSGYYSGRSIVLLAEEGVDDCIPAPKTACDIRNSLPIGTTAAANTGSVPFLYVASADHYTCPEGNILAFEYAETLRGVVTKRYRAKKICTDCPLASQCLTMKNAKRRTLKVAVEHTELKKHQERFSDPEHVKRYHQRANAVESVFGFVRSVFGYNNWLLREERASAEGCLFTAAYQLRKVHTFRNCAKYAIEDAIEAWMNHNRWPIEA